MDRTAQRTSRRIVMQAGVAAAALAAINRSPLAFAADDADAGGEVIPFLDPQAYDPKRAMVNFDELTPADWVTPTPNVYYVKHYGDATLKADTFTLEIGGLVNKPMSLTLDDIKKRRKVEVTATLECGGNGAAPNFRGAIANVKWAGTPVAPILKEAGVDPDAIEVAFWGADKGKEKIREGTYEQNFARCLSVPMATTREDILLCYEMNGKPLSVGHGFPLRLIVPGWYGIAWVKWLDRIEVRDRALKTRFMAKDYVTLRGEEVNGKTIWKETLVGPMNVKSAIARVVKPKAGPIKVTGAAWAQFPIKSVEVSIDGGPWQPAKIEERNEPFTWRFWTFDWKDAKEGEHTIVSRATDAKGRIQPTADDASMKLKKTYWEANAQWPRRVKI
jgi:DMSO/TMAO reductase YedYZ molybdopterin-dependent catalytic subunit